MRASADFLLSAEPPTRKMPFEANHNFQPPYPRPCPVCGVAMIGGKSRNDGKHFDIFRCLQCSTVIDLSGSGAHADTPDG